MLMRQAQTLSNEQQPGWSEAQSGARIVARDSPLRCFDRLVMLATHAARIEQGGAETA